MKIAIIRRRYNPFGGAERFIERLVPRLSTRNIEPTIIAESWDKTASETGVIKVASTGLTRARRFLSFNTAVTQAIQQAKVDGIKFDLIQSHERLLGADIFRLGDGVHAAWIRRLQRESGLLRSLGLAADTFHRAVLKTEKLMALDRKLHFVANSELVSNELQEYLSVPPQRIKLIPNGVDTEFFKPIKSDEKHRLREDIARKENIQISPDTLLVGFVGSGFARKGLFHLIKACSTVKNCTLIVCGKDREFKKAQRLAQQITAPGRIKLIGPMADVRPVLWASDVLCLPSLYDPSSNAVLEALACGLPVVVTENVGMATEIANADAGLICEREVISLSEALHNLLNPATRESMSSNARTYSLHYDQQRIINRWLDLYQALGAQKC